MEKISVVVLTRNNENLITRCINSILMQTYPNYEIIVVDSSSTDNTVNILKQYNNPKELIRIKCLKTNVPIGKARQIGCEMSNGEIIAYIDSDVELPYENWLENMAEPLLKGYNSPTGTFFPKEHIAGVQTLAKCKPSDPITLKYIHSRFEYKKSVIDIDNYEIVGTSHLLLRKNLIEKVGGFHPEYSDEDVRLTKAMMQFGYKFIYLKEQKCYHYYIDSNKTFIRKAFRAITIRVHDTKLDIINYFSGSKTKKGNIK